MKFISLVVTMALALVISPSAQAGDSPWPMFRHDLHHTGRSPYTGPAEPIVHWIFTANDGIASSPSIGEDGTIYVGAGWNFRGVTDSSLYAINPDGGLKWRFTPEAGSEYNGIFSSPAIGPDGTIYFGALDGYLYAIEDSITYGKLKWKTSCGSWGVYPSPAIGEDGTIYTGSTNRRISAVAPDGTVKWTYRTGWCVFSSPAIGLDGIVYIGSKDEHLYALEDSITYGKLRWKYATGEFYDGHLVDSSPAIGSDGTIYVGTDPYGAAGYSPVPVDTVFFAINPDGSLKWTFVMGDGAESSPAIGSDGTIYIGSYDGNLYAISDQGDIGVLKWKFLTRGWIDGSPTVDGCGTIYVGSRDSTVYAINPDGTLRWSFPTGGEIESSPTIDGNGILYIGSFDGRLYALGSGGPDVGVVSIDVPSEVKAGSTYIPAATVSNYRSAPQSFGTSCIIDTAGHNLYGDTLYVSELAGATSIQGIFSPWVVGPDTGVVFNITIATFLTGDDNWYNDTLTTQARAIGGVTGVSNKVEGGRQYRFPLGQCYPNPFNSTTTIRYQLPAVSSQLSAISHQLSTEGESRATSTSHVSLKVYNVLGQLVRTLVDEEQGPGYYQVLWDGRDNWGREAPSGIYFCRLKAESRKLKAERTRKMVLIK